MPSTSLKSHFHLMTLLVMGTAVSESMLYQVQDRFPPNIPASNLMESCSIFYQLLYVPLSPR